MNLRKPLATTVGAVALTIVAATSALAVNAGILRHRTESSVGTLDTTTTTVVADAPAQPNVHYVTIYVDDPAPAGAVATANPSTAQVVAPSPVTAVSSQPAAGSHDDDASEHEYEGADDDD